MRDEDEVVRIETVGKRRVYSEAEYDAAVLDADQWRQVARLIQYRLQGQLDALRTHAERLACVLEDARFYFSENDIYDYDRVMEISIDAYRAAYPKEGSDGT